MQILLEIVYLTDRSSVQIVSWSW